MNEEAILDGFKYFVSTGYNGTIEDYKQLINSNSEALSDTFKYFVSTGYNGNENDFSILMGVKKKDDSEPVGTTKETMVSTTEQAPAEDISSDLVPSDKRFSPPPQEGATFRMMTEEEVSQVEQAPVNVLAEKKPVIPQPVQDTVGLQAYPTDAVEEIPPGSLLDAEDYKRLEIAYGADIPPYVIAMEQDKKKNLSIAADMQEKAYQKALNAGVVENKKDFYDKFVDLPNYLSYGADITQNKQKIINNIEEIYLDLPFLVRSKLADSFKRDSNGNVIDIDEVKLKNSLSQEDINKIKEIAEDDDLYNDFFYTEADASKNVINTILPLQKVDYAINVAEAKKLQAEVDLLAGQGKEQEALEKYKELEIKASKIDEDAIMLNSLELALDSKKMWAPVSFAVKTAESFGSQAVMGIGTALATAPGIVSMIPGMPSEVSEWAKDKEEDILNEAIKAKEQIERALPTDRTDTISNFLGDVAGQQIFIIGSAVLGGVPAAMSAGYSMSFSEMYSEAKDNGLSHDDAMLLSRTYGAISAPLEMLGAGPVIKKVVGKKIRKEIIDKVLKEGADVFTKEAAEAAVKKSFKPIIKETLGEATQEAVQEGAQMILSKGLAEAYNEYIKEEEDPEFAKTKMFAEGDDPAILGITKAFWKELATNMALGAAGGGFGGGTVSLLQGNIYVGSNYKAISDQLLDVKNLSKLNNQLTAYRKSGKIKTDEELEVAREQLGILQSAASEIENATKDNDKIGSQQKLELFKTISERLSLEKQISNIKIPSLVADKKEQISSLDDRISKIITGEITEGQLVAEQKKVIADKKKEAPKVKEIFTIQPADTNLTETEKEIVKNGGILETKTYALQVVPVELKDVEPVSVETKDGITYSKFTGKQLLESEYVSNARKAFEARQEAAPEVEVEEQVIEEVAPEVKVELEQAKTPGEQITTTEEQTLFKGMQVKTKDGKPFSVHKVKKGSFAAIDEKLASDYKGDKPLKKFTVPPGTTIDVVKVEDTNQPVSEVRKQEEKLIDDSDAQVVKLITRDARGTVEEQYIIKDDSILETAEDVTVEAAPEIEATEELDVEQLTDEFEGLLKDPKVDFRLKSDGSVTIDEQDASEVTTKLNLSESPKADIDIEATEIEKADDIDVDELNQRTDIPLESVDIGVTEGLPHLFTISDQLRTGDTKNSLTGNIINKLKGAFGFNGTKGNETSAWANVKKDLAEKQHENAVELYQNNKEVFDKWWASDAGKKYDGLVPMAVVQMGESSIMSNEATFRVLADNMTKIPEQNKIEALSLLKKNIKEKIANLKQGIEIKKKEYNSSSAVAERKNKFKAKERERKDSFLKKEKQKAIAANKKGKKYNPKKFVAKSFQDKEYSGETKEFKELTKIKEVLDTYKTKSLGDIVSDKFAKELGSLPVRARFMSLVTTGSPVTAKGTPKQVTTGGLRGVAKVLGEGVDPRLVHLQEIVNEITDPQLKNVPIGNIVSLVGIDVKSKNQGAKKVNHPNYEWGVEGKSIGILSKPMPMESVFPKAYEKIFKDLVEKQLEQQKTPELARTKARTEQLGVGIGIPSADYRGAYLSTSVSNINKLISFLNIAFPSVNINTNSEQFNNIIASDGVKVYLKGDEVIYGVTVDGDIYINPEVHNSESQLFNTAIHEMGHVWTDYLQTTKKGREIYAKGLELVKQTDEYARQLKNFNGDTKAAANEAMAILIGNKGETIAEGSIKSKWKNWLIGMWDYIKGQFKMSKDFTSEEVQNMDLDTFLGTALADIFAGKEIKMTDSQLKKLKNPDAAFSKTDSIISIVTKGRKYGYRDEVIRNLLNRRGFKASDITEALKVDVELDTPLPAAFGNVEGGAKEGYRLFTTVREKLNKFAKEGPRGGEGTQRTKSFTEIRQKGLDLLKEDPIFQAQEQSIQNELLIDFDKSLGIKRGAEVNKQISAVKNDLKQMKIKEKELKTAQIKLKNLIRSFLPKSKDYTQADINRLIRLVEQTTVKNFDAQLEAVSEIIEKQRNKMKQSLIKQMIAFIDKNKRTTKTKGGLKRSTGISARGAAFFAATKNVIKNSLSQDYINLEKIKNNIDDSLVEKAIIKEINGEKLSTVEERAIDEAFAYDLFSDINDMSLEQVQEIFDNLKGKRKNYVNEFRNRRLIKENTANAIKEQANQQISKDYKMLYNEDGSIKGDDQLAKQKKEIWENFRKLKVWEGIKKWYSLYDFRDSKSFSNYMRNNIDHLGTLSNILDKSGKFFTENIYDALNVMYDRHYGGYYKQRGKLDIIANSIDGISDGYKEIITKLNPKIITIKNILTEGKNPTDYNIDSDEAMRIYALSKNKVQMDKLKGMGFTEDKIEEIKSHIGPEAVAFVDGVVDYLSNEYFDTVNDVYKFVNNTNLGYVENYFPTQTVPKDIDSSDLAKNNFSKQFDAETAPALKERTDKNRDILLQTIRFTETLETHLDTMERYKAYAIGVQNLVTIFESKDVNTLLEETGLKKAMKLAVNDMVNPNSIVKQKMNFIDKFLNNFTSYALNFKAIQILKQASSFVQAFEDYSFRGEGKQNIFIDLPMFMIDYASTIATLPSQYKKFSELSPTFRKRMEQGLGGDVYGLETGSKEFKPISKKGTKFAKFLRGYKKGGAFGTVAGDALGVMGYMANYNRNIANGMNKEQALKKLNDYNATQQSRRGTEKSAIQRNASTQSRAFTMFGSTLFLQINKVRSSSLNIYRDISNGKKPKAKDTRALALNFAIANMLFAFISNIAKFLVGSDEDEKQAIQTIKEAAYGLNLLYQIPLIGGAVEVARNQVRGDRKPTSDVVNPFIRVWNETYKGVKDKDALLAAKPLIEIAIGAKIDPAIGLYNVFKDGEFNEENVYDLIGISKSYRPGYGQKKKSKSKSKSKSKKTQSKIFKSPFD